MNLEELSQIQIHIGIQGIHTNNETLEKDACTEGCMYRVRRMYAQQIFKAGDKIPPSYDNI